MAQAKHGDTVRVHYTGKSDAGKILISSADSDPLQFTIGEGKIISGFEQAVIGMTPGESKTEKVPAHQAFGPYKEESVLEFDRKRIPPEIKPEVGKKIQIRQADKTKTLAVVTDISESKVTLDANHPLAGKDLVFDIQLLEIV